MTIAESLSERLANYDDIKSIGSRLRIKRIQPLLRLIEKVSEKEGSVNLIDIGGTYQYWKIVPDSFLEKNRVSITIANLPGTESYQASGAFQFAPVDGRDLSRFDDNQFHIAHSNSVVEHVGDWESMVKFSNELKRVARKYFVQTPNYWFPIEPHCMTPLFHWLPKPLRVELVRKFNLGHWKKSSSVIDAVSVVESARLLDKTMFAALFDDADVLGERFLFLTKSWVAIKN